MFSTIEDSDQSTRSSNHKLVVFAVEFAKINSEIGKACQESVTEANTDDDLVDRQTDIINEAMKVEADDIQGVLAKMSIWAADAPDLSDRNCLSRYDAILLSAFDDLSKLCNRAERQIS